VSWKGQTAEEESEKHYLITARGLRDPLGTRKQDGVLGGDEAVRRGLLHLLLGDGGVHLVGGRLLGHGVLGGQMFHAHPTQSALGGSAREEEIEEICNGGGGGNKLVNSTISPLCHLYTFWEKDRGLRCGAKIGNASPLTVKNRAAQ
jgi:hypothetical protein